MGNPWLEHIKEFRKRNPGLSFKAVLKGAKKTYTAIAKTSCKRKSKPRKSRTKSRKSGTKSRKSRAKPRKSRAKPRKRRRGSCKNKSSRGGGKGTGLLFSDVNQKSSIIESLSLNNVKKA